MFESNGYCHPFDKNITAKELYDRTKERELQIIDAGYNLVTIWEQEWDDDLL